MREKFFESVKAGDITRVRTLVQKDPSLLKAKDESGYSRVMWALDSGREDIAEFLAAKDAKLTIFEAAALGEYERIQALLRDGPALLNSHSHDGFTPLHLAAFFGRKEVAELLHSKGADLNAVSKNTTFAASNTPLDAAVAGNQLALAEWLLSNGADVNARSHGDSAPLHEAVSAGNIEFVKLLLRFGADIKVKKNDGKTPLAVAQEKGHSNIVELLREHAAKR